MKKIFAVLLLLFALSSSVYAEDSFDENEVYRVDDVKDYTPIDKLGRGLSNMTLSLGEIPKQIMRESRESNLFYGMTSGFVVGLGRSVIRAAVGVFDTATFLVPYPTDYAPIMKPAHVFQSKAESKETELEE